ncbi:MAG TPA: hypothetical protein VGG03_18650 [Thermoanaerobaculia bacterium]|jgi:hypothetical protein
MAHEITFRSEKFDVSAEDPNPINPIAGQSLLLWLRGRLHDAGYEADEPATEDWGWYIELAVFDSSYLVGASGFPEEEREDASVEWHIQIHKLRSLLDKLTGRNKLTSEDPLSRIIEGLVRNEPEFTEVEVYRG